MNKIDIVIPWVDPSDEKWQKNREKYSTKSSDTDDRDARYRDWEQLRYVFRGIEKNCSWLNKVFFITAGQIPSWLNTECSKLIVIDHIDYIPKKYLPTFSANPIELNLFRIEDLSDTFIYFNDDTFVLKELKEELFFKNDLPVYPAILHANTSSDRSKVMPYIYLNNRLVINEHFDKTDIFKHKEKWFSLKNNGLRSVIENCFNICYPEIIGLYNSHLPTPMLKRTMEEVWEEEPELLDETSRHRFRDKRDVNQYLFRYWDLMSGNFYPIDPKRLGREINISEDKLDEICKTVAEKKYPMICLNDSDEITKDRFSFVRDKINNSFMSLFPERSMFEKEDWYNKT